MRFYAYENWRAHGHRMTIHRGDCPFCNDGRGQAGGTTADNGEWHQLPESTDAETATAAARSLRAAPTIRLCRRCLR